MDFIIIISCKDPDVTAVKFFFSMDPPIQIHQSRVNKCPLFSQMIFTGNGKRSKPGRPSKRIINEIKDGL